jgi:hypothetical protein
MLKTGVGMNEEWWLKIGEKLMECLPAIGGAFVSLRYLDEKIKFFWVLFSFIASVITGIYIGGAMNAHYGVVDPAIRNFILFAWAAFGLLIIAKVNKLILQVSYKDIIEFIKSQLRKWVN